jgi:hypothetical protein
MAACGVARVSGDIEGISAGGISMASKRSAEHGGGNAYGVSAA